MHGATKLTELVVGQNMAGSIAAYSLCLGFCLGSSTTPIAAEIGTLRSLPPMYARLHSERSPKNGRAAQQRSIKCIRRQYSKVPNREEIGPRLVLGPKDLALRLHNFIPMHLYYYELLHAFYLA